MKYTKEWIAYVDDLTVRTACRKAPVKAGQPTSTALEALGIDPKGLGEKKRKRNPVVSDHNHPTIQEHV